MSVYFDKSRGKWRFDFQRYGVRHTGYCINQDTNECAASRRQALDIEGQVKGAIKKDAPVKTTNPGAYTMAEAVIDYKKNVASRNRSWKTWKIYLRELVAHFGPDTALEDIKAADIDAYIVWARQQHVMVYIGGPRGGDAFKKTNRLRSDSSINRYLTVLRAAFNRARKLHPGRVGDIPNIPRLREPQDLPNPIDIEDVRRILAAAPPHLKNIIVMAVHTGMRLGEVLSLRWEQVDMSQEVIRLDSTTKAGKGRHIYLNAVMIELLENLHSPCDHVVTLDGKPLTTIKRSWGTACKTAGLKKKHRFHDLRATFCTLLAAQDGVSMLDVKELAGHKSPATTMRYMKAADEGLRRAVTGLEKVGNLGNSHTKPSHGNEAPDGDTI